MVVNSDFQLETRTFFLMREATPVVNSDLWFCTWTCGCKLDPSRQRPADGTLPVNLGSRVRFGGLQETVFCDPGKWKGFGPEAWNRAGPRLRAGLGRRPSGTPLHFPGQFCGDLRIENWNPNSQGQSHYHMGPTLK